MQKKVLILGATGMLGHMLFNQLSLHPDLDVYATARTSSCLSQWFPPDLVKKIQLDVYADNFDTIIRAFAFIQPH
jgi:dTDP-4-dehydrorhamnose reductase